MQIEGVQPRISIMLQMISVLLFSASAVASSLNDVDQSLPAINVKFDFPSSSTLVSTKERLDIVNRDATFAKRVQHAQLKTQHLSRVLEEFANEAHDQLGALLSVVQPISSHVESREVQPSFLQVVEQKQHTAGVSMNDVEELAQDAESVSELYSSAAQGLPTLKDEQRSILVGNVEALGAIHAELLHEKHAMEAAGGIAHCANCERDHDQLCPDGWLEVADGHCSGPKAYEGPCMAFANFGTLSAKDKLEYERACLVCWPCRSPTPGRAMAA